MALSDESGNKIEEYFYNACLSAEMYMKAEGQRKDPDDWSAPDTKTDLIVDRGYTGHEHWDHFDLINMNGRVYDPQLGRFLSPDPVMQASDFTQNYNKYSYVYNNPLVFSDPTGEFAWGLVIIAAWYGGMQSLGHVAQTTSNPTWQDFAQGWLIGSSIGGATSVAGIAGSYITSIAGSTLYGAAVGASAGALNALAFDGDVGNSALYGGIIGGFSGLISGLQKYEYIQKQEVAFYRGCESLGIEPGEPVSADDVFLNDAREVWVPDAPMESIVDYTVDNVPVDKFTGKYSRAQAMTDPVFDSDGLLTGKSSVYFNERSAFTSARELFKNITHEFVHVSQIASMKGMSHLMFRIKFPYNGSYDYNIRSIMEYHAYGYNAHLGDSFSSSFPRGISVSMQEYFPELFDQLKWNNFDWITTVSFKYPF